MLQHCRGIAAPLLGTALQMPTTLLRGLEGDPDDLLLPPSNCSCAKRGWPNIGHRLHAAHQLGGGTFNNICRTIFEKAYGNKLLLENFTEILWGSEILSLNIVGALPTLLPLPS